MSSHHTSQEVTRSLSAVLDEAGSRASREADRAGGAAGAREAGAQPCITAPANSIRPLRHGVDSLYLSFAGAIEPDLADWLLDAKTRAQSPDEGIVATASVNLGDHLFLVRPSGRGRFAFVLEDNWFSLQVASAKSIELPMVLAQIRSEFLTDVGPERAIASLSMLVEQIGDVCEPAKINRVDLFADFTSTLDLTSLPGSHWVKRCKKRSIHEEGDQVTGVSFGAGNEVSARLYDKTREILKSRKDYLRPLWAHAGWNAVEQVWRLEFQIRREGLPEPMHGSAASALSLTGNLWTYLCEDWLRLAVPSDSDDTRARWPTHPAWLELARLWEARPDAPPMTRVPKTRPPSDDQLFLHGISGLTAFMGREGITDYGWGLGEYLHALEAYHAERGRGPGSVQGYMGRKARAKARRYNVRMRGHDRE